MNKDQHDPTAASADALRIARQDGIPKYLQLRNSLAEAISSGRWKTGQRIPGEEALAQITGLSLGTVQRALRILVDENLLVRKHGTGTFVARVSAPMKAPFQHCRFLDESSGEVLPIFSKVVQRRAVEGEGPWRAHLPFGPVMCIERLFSINNEFTIYTHLYFNRDRFPQLAEAAPAKLSNINFKDLLSREFHHPLARFSQSLSIGEFPAYVCTALKIKAHTTGGVMGIFAYDREGESVYFQDLYIPPNPRRLLVIP